jgi:glycosyltransferase involved in cell wall biosynthesis
VQPLQERRLQTKRSERRQRRVLAINSLFPNAMQPYWGIFNACALEYLSSMANVQVVAPVKWFPGLGLASAHERKLSKIPAKCDHHGIPVTHPRYFRTPGFGRQWHGWMYYASLKKHLIKTIEEFRPDVLLASWAHPDGYAVQRLGKELGIPVAVKCLGSDIHQLLNDKRKDQVLEALAKCDLVISVSESLRDLIARHGVDRSKIQVVYNGVDREVFRPMPRGDARRLLKLPQYGKLLLCVAALVPIKRHGDLLQAFRDVIHKHKLEAQLVLVGEGPLRQELTNLTRRLNISEHVKFAGSCKHDQIPLWVNASDVVCLTSGNEGLPNALVEALACGRPVVATNVGGVSELIESDEYGRLVRMGDVTAIAQALCDVLGRPWDIHTLSACPKVISWNQSSAQLLESLCTICK